FGIGGHRNPLFHSAIPYFGLAWLWRKLGLSEVVSTIGGPRLTLALHVGLALGLASHLLLDVLQSGQVPWIPGGTPGRVVLSGQALLLGLVAWYPQILSHSPLDNL